MADCKIISHRGANFYAPQNTLPAFKKSIKIGADGFETDVHLTKDGEPVLCHNYSVSGTSNGKGKISELMLKEIKKLDFGSYFDKKFMGVQAPTLDEFLSLVETDKDLEILNIEIKRPKSGDADIVKKTIDKVKAHGLFDKLLISSFGENILLEAKKIDENCKTAFLYSIEKKKTWSMWYKAAEYAKQIGASALHPNYIFVDKEYVERAHELGIKVNVWTVDSPKTIIKMIKCGVDGLITDCPDVCKAIVKAI